MKTAKKRDDIQLMRGVAVLAVIVFHAFGDILSNGFLGVDIFFVISGFLITGHILQGLEAGTFRFKDFYIRRARRLLPASFATLTVTSLLAIVILVPSDLMDYAIQLIGSLTFTANFALMAQTGYFAGASETKPLLHIWSLSLEEQFYFVAPLLLWLTPLRGRPWLLMAATILSLALCLFLVFIPHVAGLSSGWTDRFAFFMLPARAWELLLGGCVAWVMLQKPSLTIPHWAKYLALLILFAILVIGLSDTHPGLDAVIITLATSVILLGQDNWQGDNLITRALARIGDWSYSLYLVHWPLFAFATILYLGEPPLGVQIFLTCLSFLLGWAQYRYVEQPFLGKSTLRKGSIVSAKTAGGALSAGAVVLGTIWFSIANAHEPAPASRATRGLAVTCSNEKSEYIPSPACRSSESPTTLLWGDSHAAHLVAGMTGLDFEQATVPGCAPIPNVAYINNTHSPSRARECEQFNNSVMREIANRPEIKNVVMASVWRPLQSDANLRITVKGEEQDWSPVVRNTLERAVRDLQALGKNVILIGPTAMAGHDIGACNLRSLSGRLTLRSAECGATSEELERTIGKRLGELRSTADATGAELLLPSEALCPLGQCVSIIEGESIYVDKSHLSHPGSIYTVDQIGLRQALEVPPKD